MLGSMLGLGSFLLSWWKPSNGLNAIIGGCAAELARKSAGEVVEQGGNGGLEVVSWLIAAATVPGSAGEIIYYEPIPEWFTGMGGVVLTAVRIFVLKKSKVTSR